MLSASLQQARYVETCNPKRHGRAGCTRASLYILDRGNQKYLAVIPWRKPFRVLNVPRAIANLYCWPGTCRILNEDRIGVAVNVIADPIRLKGEPLAIG